MFINTTSIGGLVLRTGRHEAYDALVDKVMSVTTDPKTMATYSFPEQIAEVVYEAATDGKEQRATSLAPTRRQRTRPGYVY